MRPNEGRATQPGLLVGGLPLSSKIDRPLVTNPRPRAARGMREADGTRRGLVVRRSATPRKRTPSIGTARLALRPRRPRSPQMRRVFHILETERKPHEYRHDPH